MIFFKTSRADLPFVVLANFVFFLALFISLWDFLGQQSSQFGVENAFGFLLFVIGYALRQVGKRELGKYYSYGLQTTDDQALVTTGVYRRIRHPISLATLVYSLAIPLAFSSAIGFVIMILIIPLFLYRLRIEEEMLLERFGDEYRNYITKTKRLLPYVY